MLGDILMIERILEKVAKEFKMIEKENKEFRFLQLNGMNFNNSSYYAEGLGNIGIMKVTDDKGIMEMAGLIINPFELDGPLLSYDHISKWFYSCQLSKGGYSLLEFLQKAFQKEVQDLL